MIVDHKLRKESTDEALWVKNYLQSKGIFAEILTWKHNGVNANIQEKARIARYALLTDYCKSRGIDALYTAHNSNDQAETILYRIIRGTGVDGLVGIRASTMMHGIRVERPLLNILRTEIESQLELQGWQWVDDPSNKCAKYDRVKIRNWLISCPMRDKLIASCAELSNNCSTTKSYLDKQTANFIKKHVNFDQLGFASIKADAFKVDKQICLRALKEIFKKVSYEHKMPKSASFMEMLNTLRSWSGAGKTLMKCHVFLKNSEFYFVPEHKLMPVLNVNTAGMHNYFGREINCAHVPCCIQALGENGWKQLPEVYRAKVSDYRIGKSLIGVFAPDGVKLLTAPQIGFMNA